MGDYIDREAFRQKCIEVLSGIKVHPMMTLHEMHIIASIDTVCHIIDDMPAADVRPVVRCKDCKYWRPISKADENGPGRGECKRHCTTGWKETFFCADGRATE